MEACYNPITPTPRILAVLLVGVGVAEQTGNRQLSKARDGADYALGRRSFVAARVRRGGMMFGSGSPSGGTGHQEGADPPGCETGGRVGGV